MSGRLLLLDGSMSSHLKSFGYDTDKNKPHWTFPANNDLDLMEKVYKSFLSLGVNIATTNTYHYGSTMDSTLPGNAKNEAAHIEQFKNTCDLLCQLVRMNNNSECQVWGSVGTLATMYHDLSEYTGNYMDKANSQKIAKHYYNKVLHLFQSQTEIRHLIFETIPSEKEASSALKILRRFPSLKAVFSFTFKGNAQLRHGENIDEIASKLKDCPQVLGIGINCTDPLHVMPVLNALKKHDFNRIFVYPNSGDSSLDESSHSISHELIRMWADNGATAIGGCCGVDEKQLKSIRDSITILNSTN